MEAELLRSKTEMMLLNNQLLEAVQKRLELSLELEAWKVLKDGGRRERESESEKWICLRHTVATYGLSWG